jgi:hypothetical protein
MKANIAILALLSVVSAEKLIFEEDFTKFNFSRW